MSKTIFIQSLSLLALILSTQACSKVNFNTGQNGSADSLAISTPLSQTDNSSGSAPQITPPSADPFPADGQFAECFYQFQFSHDPVAFLNPRNVQNFDAEFINLIQNANSDIDVKSKELDQVNSVEGNVVFDSQEVGLISDVAKSVTGSAECITQIQNVAKDVSVSNQNLKSGEIGQIHNVEGNVVVNNFNVNNIHDIQGSLALNNSNVIELANVEGDVILTNVRVRYLHNVKGHISLINSVVEQSDQN